MSHIFDALQRSEAERSGTASSSDPTITELLERAERQTSAKWADLSDLELPQSEIASEEVPALAAVEESISSLMDDEPYSVPLPASEPADVLRQCRSLPITVTAQNRLVSVTASESPAAEAFRLLSVRLRHMRRNRQLQKLLITSTIPQEGKSVCAANLACALFAGTRQKVLLLEGDIRRPTLSKVFGLGPYPGLCEWLQGKRSLLSSIYHLESAGIWILPAGSASGNPLELLQSGKLSALMDQLVALFDWVIVDSPPVLPLADTSVWTRVIDGILLVARQGITEKRHLQRGIEALETKKLIGALLNSSRNLADNEYYAYRRPSEDSATR